jgi:hypothetical protein
MLPRRMHILQESNSDMALKIEDYVIDIVEIAGEKLNRSFNIESLSWISRPDNNSQVADAAMILKVKARARRHDAVLIISNPRFPNFVAGAVNKTKQVYERVQPSIKETVLLPDFHDNHGEQSFAVYPKLIPVSENRLVRRVQKHMIDSDVNEWLCELCDDTKQPAITDDDVEERLLKPLSHVSSESGFSADLRKSAEATLEAIERRDFQPAFTIQHGDFWLGNILLKSGWPFISDKKYPFSVIDWGTANLKGYPFVDLLRYALSTTKNETKICKDLHSYSRRRDIPLRQLPDYVCASIGWLGLHRDNFPMERYVSSSEELFLMASRFGAEK